MKKQIVWTKESLYDNLKNVTVGGSVCLFTPEKCAELVPIINEINQLKKEKKATILAHSYVSPEILNTVADCVGDSYELSKFGRDTDADIIVFAAVKFMAETAKLLSPNKTVIVPSKENGCSLADSITQEQVQELRKQYPGYTFVCYINTTAAVKAECDVCVTSSVVYDIVEALPNDKIYFLPDKLMGKNLVNEMKKRGVKKDIQYWSGTCYVHEEFDPDMIDYIRSKHEGVEVLSHPECDEEVVKRSDYVGSTSQMVNHVKASNNSKFFMLTECGLATRLQTEDPSKQFVGTCTMCKYMKANTLQDILKALKDPSPESIIEISEEDQKKANCCIEKMFEFSPAK